MAVNADKPLLWKQDIARSVDFYNSWFMEFAPTAYRNTRIATTQQVESALTWTANLTNITPAVLRQHPSVLPILRMATAPPIARDRLIGLAGVPPNLVKNMEMSATEKERVLLQNQLDEAKTQIERNKLGQFATPSSYSFPGLQKKRGVSYDPERDLPAIRSCAVGELVELPPSATKQLRGMPK